MESNDFNLPVGSKLYPVFKRIFDKSAVRVLDRADKEFRSAIIEPSVTERDSDFAVDDDDFTTLVFLFTDIWVASRYRSLFEWGVKSATKTVGGELARLEIVKAVADALRGVMATFRSDIAKIYDGIKAAVSQAIQDGKADASRATQMIRAALKRWFGKSNRVRARRIARTEAVNLYHRAVIFAARQSGIVAGFEWITVQGACELCLAIEGDGDSPTGRRRVRLGQPFAYVGGRAIYHPTAHPNCMCTLIAIFDRQVGYWSSAYVA